MKRFLTSREARAALRCSYCTLSNYAAAGILNPVIINRRRRLWREDEILRILGEEIS